MIARCTLLAHKIPTAGPTTYRCPTTPPTRSNRTAAFHYHGDDKSQPYRLLVGGAICEHRHQTERAARRCSAAAGAPR